MYPVYYRFSTLKGLETPPAVPTERNTELIEFNSSETMSVS